MSRWLAIKQSFFFDGWATEKFDLMVGQLTNLMVGQIPTYAHPWLRLCYAESTSQCSRKI